MNRDRKGGEKGPRAMRLPASPFVSPARSVADLAAGPIAEILGKRGFAGADIFTHWRAIVGEELADACAPEKIAWPRADLEADADRGAVLHVRVSGPQAVEIQHRAGEILERVNRMFGYAAIARLRIAQAPLHRRERAEPARRKAGTQGEGDSDSLEAALARLERAVRGE